MNSGLSSSRWNESDRAIDDMWNIPRVQTYCRQCTLCLHSSPSTKHLFSLTQHTGINLLQPTNSLSELLYCRKFSLCVWGISTSLFGALKSKSFYIKLLYVYLFNNILEMNSYYLHQGGYVFTSVHLFVGWLVCSLKLLIGFLGNLIEEWDMSLKKKLSNFGVDHEKLADPEMLTLFFYFLYLIIHGSWWKNVVVVDLNVVW